MPSKGFISTISKPGVQDVTGNLSQLKAYLKQKHINDHVIYYDYEPIDLEEGESGIIWVVIYGIADEWYGGCDPGVPNESTCRKCKVINVRNTTQK